MPTSSYQKETPPLRTPLVVRVRYVRSLIPAIYFRLVSRAFRPTQNVLCGRNARLTRRSAGAAPRTQRHVGQGRCGQRTTAERVDGAVVGAVHPRLAHGFDLGMGTSDEVPPHDDLLVERLAAEEQEHRLPADGEVVAPTPE